MAGPFQPYDPENQKRTGSPLSPGNGNPVSFRTNVNRAKTKRWVEAKQYSYDGDDWGDDDYDEYDEHPPPVPQLPSQSNDGASGLSPGHSPRLSLLGMDRSRSTDQVASLGSDGSRDGRSHSADGKGKEVSSATDSKPLPFIRPADIYKRLAEEKAGQRGQTQDAGRLPDEASQQVGPSHPDPASKTSPPTSMQAHDGVAYNDDRGLHPLDPATESQPGNEELKSTTNSSREAPISSLPEVKRLSSFGSDVLGQSTPTAQPTSALDSQRPSLQHSSSFGLQSAVHQAFDVPETPDSTRDSVSRSNSDSTSLISPIIGSRPVDDQKTPTIAEEPGESVSTPADTPGGVAFKPGHRRDISLPSPDNNPSKKPSISESVPYPQSANAEMSSTDPSRDYFQLYRPSVEPYGTSEESQPQGNDLPAPLRPNNSSQAKADGAEDSLPVIVPTISNDNSPEDTENDRLRREIIRSLSRENSPSEEPDRASGSEPQQSASLNPNEYESHRGNETGRPALEPEEPKSGAQLQSSGPPKTFDELLSDTPPIPEPATEQAPKPKLSRRFSWESSSSEEIPPTADFGASPQQTAPPLGQAPPASDNQLDPEPLPNYQETTSDEDALGSRPSTEKPKLTIIPPSTVDESSVSDRHLPEVMYDEAAQSVPPVVDGSADQALVPVSAPPPPSVEPTLLGFRDILGIKSASERVQSFDRTRDQFSAIDTGLNHWIQVTVNAHPEHLDTVQQSLKSAGSAPKPSMSKGKFPKLSSLGNLASSLHDAGPSGSLHTRRGSTHVMNRQQVEQRGKDLLHSAGVLGGRAGGAAKGFFAKGKSKLNRGGADKGLQSSRRSFHLPEDPLATDLRDSPGSRHYRHSLHIGSLPFLLRGPEKPVASEGAQNRRFSASVSNTIDGLSKPNTAGNRTQPDITERRQPSSSHIDAIPDAPIADSSVPEQPYAPDFERELVAALRLDIDPHAQQLDKPDAVPCNEDTSVSSRTQSLAIGPGTVSDSGISATRPTLEDVEIPGPQLDEGTTENGQGQVNDERHVNDPESQRLRDRPYEPPRITFSASDDDSHQHEQAQVGNEDSGVPSRSLSHASNVTASESLSQESNVTLVLASKAVRAGQIHLVINGVPQAIPAGEKYPGLNFDEWRSSHEEQAGDGSLDSTEAQPAFSTGEPKTLKLTHTDDGSPPVGSKAQGHPSSPQGQHVRQTPSFSSLGASEAGLSAQQPQLGCGLAQPNHSEVSLLSEHGNTTPYINRATQHVSDLSSSATSRPSPLRNETTLSTDTRDSLINSPSEQASNSHQSAESMKVHPPTSGQNLTVFTAQVPPEHQQAPKGPSAMNKLKNIGRLRRISLGSDGPRKNALGRLSGLFNRPGPLPESGRPPYNEPRSYSSIEGPSSSPYSGQDSANRSSFQGQRPPPGGYFAPTSPPVGHNLTAGMSEPLNHPALPPQNHYSTLPTQPAVYRPPVRHSMPSPPTLPPPTRKPDPPPRGRFYAQNLRVRSRSPPYFAPRPDTHTIVTSDRSDPAHGLGIFREQRQTSRVGDQETPWRLTIPEEAETESPKPKVPRKPVGKAPPSEGDSAARMEGENTGTESSESREEKEKEKEKENHPTRGEGRAVNEAQAPVELPVGKDDSSEEIIMSSTAYPGQEWQPAGFGGWEHY